MHMNMDVYLRLYLDIEVCDDPFLFIYYLFYYYLNFSHLVTH